MGPRIAVFLFLAVQLARAGPAPAELRVTVRVLNYAAVPSAVMVSAEAQATWVYQQVGVATQWFDCSLPTERALRSHFCQTPLGSAGLVIKVLPREMMGRFRMGRAVLGFAALPDINDEQNFATDAFVCDACIQELAAAKGQVEERRSLHAAILGSVMAHEVGHLLMGMRGHATAGVMHAIWGRKEIVELSQGRLLFTNGEQQKIRVQVRLRMQERPGDLASVR